MALRKVFKDPFASSIKGSFTGNSLEPHNTVCSIICATPVESLGGVRNPIENTLLSSVVSIRTTFAFVFSCSSRYPWASSSVNSCCTSFRYPSTAFIRSPFPSGKLFPATFLSFSANRLSSSLSSLSFLSCRSSTPCTGKSVPLTAPVRTRWTDPYRHIPRHGTAVTLD